MGWNKTGLLEFKNIMSIELLMYNPHKIGAIVRSPTEDYLELEIDSPFDTTAKIKTAETELS